MSGSDCTATAAGAGREAATGNNAAAGFVPLNVAISVYTSFHTRPHFVMQDVFFRVFAGQCAHLPKDYEERVSIRQKGNLAASEASLQA